MMVSVVVFVVCGGGIIVVDGLVDVVVRVLYRGGCGVDSGGA